jgi:hypothetical protein
MILRSKTIDLAKLKALAGAYNLGINGSEHGLSRGEFKGGHRIDFKLELIEPTPRDPEKTAQFQRRSSMMMTVSGYPRKVRAVCWHGHREVMKSIFAYDPEARLMTSMADYRGADSFRSSFERTGDRNIGSRVACDCNEFDDQQGTKVAVMNQGEIAACPQVIFNPAHYRSDGSCKCDDLFDPYMAEWGYQWSVEEGRWV